MPVMSLFEITPAPTPRVRRDSSAPSAGSGEVDATGTCANSQAVQNAQGSLPSQPSQETPSKSSAAAATYLVFRADSAGAVLLWRLDASMVRVASTVDNRPIRRMVTCFSIPSRVFSHPWKVLALHPLTIILTNRIKRVFTAP